MLRCDICSSELVMNAGGQSARCKCCGMTYSIDRLREMLRSSGPASAAGAARATSGAASSADFEIRGGVLYRYNGNAETLTIPSHVVEIAEKAFADNRRLKEVTIPANVKKICKQAFSSCTALETVRLSDSIEVIESAAFYNSGLRKVTVPPSIRQLHGAFYGCPQLQEITFLDGRTEIHEVCTNCPSLTEVRLPATLKTLSGTFFGCTALRHVLLPEGLERIGRGAFQGCTALEAVRVPATVREIDEAAFKDCKNLRHAEMADQLATDAVFLQWYENDRGPDGYECNSNTSPWYTDLYKRRQAAAARARENQIRMWKSQGRCIYCGGQFSGIFSPKCTSCRSPKNY